MLLISIFHRNQNYLFIVLVRFSLLYYFSFPFSKIVLKCFLKLPSLLGRVARAGRSGKSYNLIAPDEIPYLADLFLYLGRPLEFAKSDSVYEGNSS